MKKWFIFFLPILLSAQQLKVISTIKIPISPQEQWDNPQFSSDGNSIYFTNASFDGIWKFSLKDQQLLQITNDANSGYGFSISADDKQICYRRTQMNAVTHERKQDAVVLNLETNSKKIITSGSDVSLPFFTKNSEVHSINKKTESQSSLTQSTDTIITGIDETKISLLVQGKKSLFDPLKNVDILRRSGSHPFGRSYIWPSLSPDKKRIVAYEMSHGAFVCDLQGANLVLLGRRDAPVWTRNGKWIVYMNDIDDGRMMTSSEIMVVSADGVTTQSLTSTSDRLELNPRCSPTENKIVFNTSDSEIFILTYEEIQ